MTQIFQPQSGTTLSASATAHASHTKTFNWTINKTVTPDKWNFFEGDSGTSEYTITVTKDQGTEEAVISGEICVTNGGAVATQNLTINFDVQRNPSTIITTGVPVNVSKNPILDPGESDCYPYSFTIPSGAIVNGATYKITAHVTISNHSGHDEPFGPSPSATAVLPAATLVNNSITVSDTNGGVFPFSNSGSVNYNKTFTCDDEGSNDNTATIIYDSGTGPSVSASVSVNCYQLDVSKDANTSFTRTYNWTIKKEVSEDNLVFGSSADIIVPVTNTHPAYYKVTVAATSDDDDYSVDGTITIHNPAPIAATINSISDSISGTITTTTCSMSFPFVLNPEETITCEYTAALPDNSPRVNTATVTIQNYSFDTEGNATERGTTDFTGTANVTFSNNPSLEINRCINVSDSLQGALGTVDAADTVTKTVTYLRDIGPYSECGTYKVENTASFIPVKCDTGNTEANDAGGESSATVNVTVPCKGCTYTIGYWRTHAGFTGNNPDLVSPLLPIKIGNITILKPAPGSHSTQAYNILSFSGDPTSGTNRLMAQLLAAKLNIKNGADASAIMTTIDLADSFLSQYGGIQWSQLNRSLKAQAISLASKLEQYNSGSIGPGHCSESGPPQDIIDTDLDDFLCCDKNQNITINISNSRNFRLNFKFNISDNE